VNLFGHLRVMSVLTPVCLPSAWRLRHGVAAAVVVAAGGWVIGVPSAEDQALLQTVQVLRETCHDMRQPVASLFALAAATLAEPGLPPAARARLELMVGQAEWLAELIRHSLQQVGGLDAPWAGRADLGQVACEVAGAERTTWPGTMKLISRPAVIFAEVHPVLVRRMVANLVGNATRAAGPCGTVTVEISLDQHWAVLAVEDTGPGFGEIPKGLGLGLPAVSRTAARYGGRLECGSGASGGTRVTLWLPPSSAQPASGGSRVDDSPGIPAIKPTGTYTGLAGAG
jgi:signal transduction histidine kinase